MNRLQPCDGPVYFHPRTKQLTHWIPEGSFALLDHQDIDETAAIALIGKKVKGVLNYKPSMTGEYASGGTIRLVEHGIPVYDIEQPQRVKRKIRQGQWIRLEKGQLWLMENNKPSFASTLFEYTPSTVRLKWKMAQLNFNERFQSFVQNTLEHMQRDLQEILKPLHLPPLSVDLTDQTVVVVTRGRGYLEDLMALRPYIDDLHPILIGVDGGADALLQQGLKPHLIIGDMDSVSNSALHCGAELVVHAYSDGRAPGLEVAKRHGLKAYVFPCIGTSEDAAYLLADQAGAKQIISVGSHTHMLEFLEKGRQGMASTLLVRLMLGNKLIDVKGIHHLFPARRDWNRHVRREHYHTGV